MSRTAFPAAAPNLWSPWQRFLIALDGTGRTALRDLQRQAQLEGLEAQRCQLPHELWALQAAFATEAGVRVLRLHEQCWIRWFELWGGWWHQGEALGVLMLQSWQPPGSCRVRPPPRRSECASMPSSTISRSRLGLDGLRTTQNLPCLSF